jgi:hypothetical protein
MTYDEIMKDIVGARPKFEEPTHLMNLVRELIEQNEEMQRRIKILRDWNEYYKKANVALMQENTDLILRGH